MMVTDGKNHKGHRAIIDLSHVTVEKHTRLAREALDVETASQAVQKASALYQLFLGKDREKP